MQLISPQFFLFWLITTLIFFLVRKRQWIVLLIASLAAFFLFSRGLPLLILMEALILYVYGRISEKGDDAGKKSFLPAILGLVGILILCRHIFGSFLAGNAGFLFPLLGISFYTMSAVAYAADVRLGKIRPEKNFARLLLMLVFFPSILQGPIHRYDEISGELFREHRFSVDGLILGGVRVFLGLMKKLVIVPRLSVFTEAVFGGSAEATAAGLIAGTLAFFVELYADWSGYMDLVLGIAETLGIRMRENFARPFFATSISEVWKRWHITLSSWFKDYVYIPLGGSRRGTVRTICNLFIVWILTGFWHGASAGYLIWGMYFAILSAVGIFTRRYAIIKSRLLRCAGTWLLTAAGFFFFAAGSFSNLQRLLSGAAGYGSFGARATVALWTALSDRWETIVLLLALLIWFLISLTEEKGREVRKELLRSPLFLRFGSLLFLVFFVILCGRYGQQYNAGAFLYQGF